METYTSQPQQKVVQTKTFSKAQGSMLTKSLLISGICFILVCAASIGWGIMFANLYNDMSWQTWDLVYSLYFVALFVIIASMILSMVWQKKIKTAGIGLTAMVFIIYILGQSLGFGMVFGLIIGEVGYDDSTQGMTAIAQLGLIFGVTGILFALMAFVGSIMNNKVAMTMKKFMMVGMMIVFGMMLFISMMWLFSALFWMPSYTSANWFYWLIILLMAPLMLCYVAYDIYQIKKMDTFNTLQGKEKMNITLMFAFKLLVDLVGLMWIVLAIFMRVRR